MSRHPNDTLTVQELTTLAESLQAQPTTPERDKKLHALTVQIERRRQEDAK